MAKFKVGDKIRLINPEGYTIGKEDFDDNKKGQIFTVRAIEETLGHVDYGFVEDINDFKGHAEWQDVEDNFVLADDRMQKLKKRLLG